MQRPTRDALDRQVRAALVLYGVPHEPITEHDGRARFDEHTEEVITYHVETLDRLWAEAEQTERIIQGAHVALDRFELARAEPTAERYSLKACADSILNRESDDVWRERYAALVEVQQADAITALDARYADRAAPANPGDPYDDIGGEA